jgi:integrase
MMTNLENRVLTKAEIRKVIKWSRMARRKNKPNTQRNYAIFRLSACCGLRCSEIGGLNLSDFFFKTEKPFIRIRKEITKGHRRPGTTEVIRKARMVPLTHDDGVRDDLLKWWNFRMEQSGGDRSAPFVCGQSKDFVGNRMGRCEVASAWKTSIRCLGVDRARSLSIHSGRHTAITHLLWAGMPLVWVKNFAGHANIATTSEYAHLCDDTNLPTGVFS